jgi:UTP--glucose-1-phosphate uridylyltransferase
MAAALKSALPSHLKPSSLSPNGDPAEFARKHHGKTQSHMVSYSSSFYQIDIRGHFYS